MADIHIERAHGMSLENARKAATDWAAQAEKKFDMACTYVAGQAADELSFTRSGVSGTLTVTPEAFQLRAKLGFLLSAFKDRIESEVVKNLEALVANNSAPAENTSAESATPPNAPAAPTASNVPVEKA